MVRRYAVRSKEEKMEIVKQVLQGTPIRNWEDQGIGHHQVKVWTKKYMAEGEAGWEPKKKPGNPLSRYERRKEIAYEEKLQYYTFKFKKICYAFLV